MTGQRPGGKGGGPHPLASGAGVLPEALPDYAELHCLSCFSFLRGASTPQELVARAAALGYRALALTDECSVAGVVRAHQAAQEAGLHLIVGSEFVWEAGRLVVLVRDAQGWGDLCEFISAVRADAPKGAYRLHEGSPWHLLGSCEVLVALQRGFFNATDLIATRAYLQRLRALLEPQKVPSEADFRAPVNLGLLVELHLSPEDGWWQEMLEQLSATLGLPLVAAGDVHMHVRSRKPLQDVMTAVRLGRPVAQCGFALQPNAERHLRQRLRLASLYAPEMLAATVQIAQRCTFRLDEIRYRYPTDTVPPGMTATQALAWHTWQGAQSRYPQGIPDTVRAQLERELDLIADCGYEMYFLTVHDIVRYARSQGILCQGRGSAANSAVCYVLGITAVDPEHSHLLFERFISRERSEPPDIDVDFEHDRREEVIQYLYSRYGRDRAAIAAVVTTYRTRSALRDVGKALAVPADLIDAFAKDHHGFDESVGVERLQTLASSLGIALQARTAVLWLQLSEQLIGMPRHLSQHVGGFVLTQGKLTRLVPVEPASMPGRSIIQWDKDDLDAMGLLKVDVLALGMLTALRKSLELRAAVRGEHWGLADIPREDPATYDMVCAADTMGVFQIESRAQMSMLPRLQPRCFYDLVVEVAIVRPGPIQGGMVHPFLQARERARQGLPLDLPQPQLRGALARTLGVPIFQEQVMQIAMIAADFSPGEADELRRSMAAWKRKGGVHRFEQRLLQGMRANGYPEDFAHSIFQQMLGFGEYGFPESHAHSFALLAYASSWFKCHEPACFLAALLNAQPMGFYGPSQLLQDARRRGLRIRPMDVNASDWDCTLEGDLQALPPARWTRRDGTMPAAPLPQPALRLGLRLVKGLSRTAALRLMDARQSGPFATTHDLACRARLNRWDLQVLAAADALSPLAGHRRQQMWAASTPQARHDLLDDAPLQEPVADLPAAPEGEAILFDYAATGLSLRGHPVALLRERLTRARLRTAWQLQSVPPGSVVRACGIVTVRQRPATAKGTLFVSLEDETGTINVVVWPALVEVWREPLLRARLLAVEGVWQGSHQGDKAGQGPGAAPAVRHLVARRFKDLSAWLGRLGEVVQASRDFH